VVSQPDDLNLGEGCMKLMFSEVMGVCLVGKTVVDEKHPETFDFIVRVKDIYSLYALPNRRIELIRQSDLHSCIMLDGTAGELLEVLELQDYYEQES
jgi:hypothetical protein